jgi:hypothetical protein
MEELRELLQQILSAAGHDHDTGIAGEPFRSDTKIYSSTAVPTDSDSGNTGGLFHWGDGWRHFPLERAARVMQLGETRSHNCSARCIERWRKIAQSKRLHRHAIATMAWRWCQQHIALVFARWKESLGCSMHRTNVSRREWVEQLVASGRRRTRHAVLRKHIWLWSVSNLRTGLYKRHPQWVTDTCERVVDTGETIPKPYTTALKEARFFAAKNPLYLG